MDRQDYWIAFLFAIAMGLAVIYIDSFFVIH